MNSEQDNQSNNIKRVWWVDFIKGVSMIMIVLCHAAQGFYLPKFAENAFKFGQMGVQIFFLLSAFTICKSLDVKKRLGVNFC